MTAATTPGPNTADRERARHDIDTAMRRVQAAHESLTELMPPVHLIAGNDHAGAQEREDAKQEVAQAEQALAALGDVENLAARYLTARGQVAYELASGAALKSARDSAAQKYYESKRAFQAVSTDPKASLEELFAAWSALRVTYDSHLVSVETLNPTVAVRRSGQAEGVAAKSFAAIVEVFLAEKVANASRTARSRLLATVSEAGNAAVLKVTKS